MPIAIYEEKTFQSHLENPGRVGCVFDRFFPARAVRERVQIISCPSGSTYLKILRQAQDDIFVYNRSLGGLSTVIR
jgi:hypothetical protein